MNDAPATSAAPDAGTAPSALVVAPGDSFADMAWEILRSADAQTLVAHVQRRLELALVAAGFAVEAWRLRENPAVDKTMVVQWTSLQMTDPLTNTAFETYLLLTLKQATNGCMLTMRTEARELLSKRTVVERELLLFLSWDEKELSEVCAEFRKALATLAVRPDTMFADSDFEILAQKLTLALAP